MEEKEKLFIEIRIRRKLNFLPWNFIKPDTFYIGEADQKPFVAEDIENLCKYILHSNKNIVAVRWNWK